MTCDGGQLHMILCGLVFFSAHNIADFVYKYLAG